MTTIHCVGTPFNVQPTTTMYSKQRNRSGDMASIDDLDMLTNVGQSFSSLDIDNVFKDEAGKSKNNNLNTRDLKQRFYLQTQRDSISKITNIDDAGVSAESRNLNKVDRASTLGSFSIGTGSFYGMSFPEDASSIPSLGHVGHDSKRSEKSTSESIIEKSVKKDTESSDRKNNKTKDSNEQDDKKSKSSHQPKDDTVDMDDNVVIEATRNNKATSKSNNKNNDNDDDNVSNNNNNKNKNVPSNKTSDNNNNGVGAEPIRMPHDNDVLLGRGGRNNQWSGNEKLRHFALELSSAYRNSLKRNKPAIAWVLVTRMRELNPPGRFLKQDQAAGEWHEVDDDTAREKASQCLRDIVASRAKVGGNLAIDGNATINSKDADDDVDDPEQLPRIRSDASMKSKGKNRPIPDELTIATMHEQKRRRMNSAPDLESSSSDINDLLARRRISETYGMRNATFGMNQLSVYDSNNNRNHVSSIRDNMPLGMTDLDAGSRSNHERSELLAQAAQSYFHIGDPSNNTSIGDVSMNALYQQQQQQSNSSNEQIVRQLQTILEGHNSNSSMSARSIMNHNSGFNPLDQMKLLQESFELHSVSNNRSGLISNHQLGVHPALQNQDNNLAGLYLQQQNRQHPLMSRETSSAATVSSLLARTAAGTPSFNEDLALKQYLYQLSQNNVDR